MNTKHREALMKALAEGRVTEIRRRVKCGSACSCNAGRGHGEYRYWYFWDSKAKTCRTVYAGKAATEGK